VAALSFLVGVYITTPKNVEGSVRGTNNVKGVEVGFEPPRVKRDDDSSGRNANDRGRENRSGKTSADNQGISFSQIEPTNNKDNQGTASQIEQQERINNPQPRIVGLLQQPNKPTLVYRLPSTLLNESSIETIEESIPSDGYIVEESWYSSNAEYFMDGHDFDKCIPMEKWQLESFVDCNKFHELDLQKLRMINRG
jgi:hypothetical protein